MNTCRVRYIPQPDGIYIEVSRDGVLDRIGPFKEGEELVAILEPPKQDLRLPAKTLRKRSQRAEQQLAEREGGRAQKASGALPGYKGDVRVKGRWRFEHKYTQKSSYSLKKSDLDKILGHCQGDEQPVFVVEFVTPVTLHSEERFYVVRESTWRALHDDPPRVRKGLKR